MNADNLPTSCCYAHDSTGEKYRKMHCPMLLHEFIPLCVFVIALTYSLIVFVNAEPCNVKVCTNRECTYEKIWMITLSSAIISVIFVFSKLYWLGERYGFRTVVSVYKSKRNCQEKLLISLLFSSKHIIDLCFADFIGQSQRAGNLATSYTQ